MNGALRVDPGDAVPIWKQIEEGIRRLVVSGALPKGASAPSVRELAKELRVNPATVSKAYQRLVEAGVLVVRRGEGTYVNQAQPALAKAGRSALLREAALRYAGQAMAAEARLEDAQGALERAWATLNTPEGEA